MNVPGAQAHGPSRNFQVQFECWPVVDSAGPGSSSESVTDSESRGRRSGQRQVVSRYCRPE